MGLLDALISTITSNLGGEKGATNPLQSSLNSLLEQNGGMQGLMEKFQQGGLGDVFSSWVGTGSNLSISPEQIQSVLGSEQVQAIASRLGLDVSQISSLFANYLPGIVDKLTPNGQIDGNSNMSGGLASLLPTLLSSLGGKGNLR